MNEKKLTLLPSDELFDSICQLLSEGYDAQFTVTGNSMWPFFAHERDRVTLRSVPCTTLKKGDIVLYRAKHGYLLHRIMRIKHDFVQTAGDHNCYLDEPVSQSIIIAKVVSFTRKEKEISCQNLSYRLISFFWRIFFPIRPILLRILFCFIRRIGR